MGDPQNIRPERKRSARQIENDLKAQKLDNDILALVKHCDKRNITFPRNKEIAAALNIGYQTVSQSVMRLLEAGAIEETGAVLKKGELFPRRVMRVGFVD